MDIIEKLTGADQGSRKYNLAWLCNLLIAALVGFGVISGGEFVTAFLGFNAYIVTGNGAEHYFQYKKSSEGK